MKLKMAVIVAALMVPIAAWAALKTWSNGETLKAADLNSNFTQVNTAATALITDAKVSSSAAISHSKLATPALVPKAWAIVKSTCTTGTCTVNAGSKISSISHAGTGDYLVTLSYTAADTNYAMLVTAYGNSVSHYCVAYGGTTTTFGVYCKNESSNVAEDWSFSVLVMDDN